MIFSRKIKHFMKVIEEGSYTKASESLCLTSSALRHSIYELEKGVSSKLFLRCHSGVVLTDNGQCLYDSLFPVYHEANRIYHEFMQENSASTRLKIFMDGFYYPDAVDCLNDIQALLNKDVVISQIDKSAQKELAMGHCDIAISTVFGIPIPSKSISNLFLSREEMGVLVSKTVRKRHKDIRSLLKQETVLHRSELLNHPVLEYVRKRIRCYGMEYNVTGMPDISDIMETISGGTGLTLISADFISKRSLNEYAIEFIPHPFPDPIVFERHMFFNAENYHELSKVASILKNSCR
jgi:DNA-binding transcriptional LysR family regulator